MILWMTLKIGTNLLTDWHAISIVAFAIVMSDQYFLPRRTTRRPQRTQGRSQSLVLGSWSVWRRRRTTSRT